MGTAESFCWGRMGATESLTTRRAWRGASARWMGRGRAQAPPAQFDIIGFMLVLASASPRRRELLAQAGFQFTVAPASIDEDLRLGENAVAYVTRLAREKAQSVYGRMESPVVLGADTTVVAPNGEVLGKPADAADAARMLRLLSGATHQVITGVAVASGSGVETAAEVTHVTVLTLSDEEIAA